MRRLTAIALLALLTFFQAPLHAQERYYNQAELDALLAPIALYPDPLLSQVLMAATYPEDVREAAAWSHANPHLTGEDAVRAAQDQPWDPSVKSLLAFPEVLARMEESPQWMADLGQAFLFQEPYVMETVQGLRRRAQASGYLQNDQTYVHQEGTYIAIHPLRPQLVYVPYYDPLVVYGGWWWPAHRPVYWRPWRPAPVVVSTTFFFGAVDWHRRYVTVVRQPTFVHAHPVYVSPGRWRHVHRRPAVSVRPYVAVPEAHRQPIVRSMPPASAIESPRREHKREFKREWSHEKHRDRGDARERRVEPAQIAKPVTPAPPVQPGFERREFRREQRAETRPLPKFHQPPVHLPKHEPRAEVARPVAPAVRVQPGFERRDMRHERREWHPAGASPNSARLSSFQGRSDDHRDAGRRYNGGAKGNAPHSRRKD